MAFKFFIDKGHGGDDPGAVGNGMREADIVDVIGDYLAQILKGYEGVEVKIGPRPKGHTSAERLTPRTVEANKWDADFFVSLHINAGGGTGNEVLVNPTASTESRRVAKIINTEVTELFKSNGMPDRGVKDQSVQVLRKSNMPSCLVEFGFIDTAKDASLLKTDAFRKKCAEAVAEGLAKAYNLKKKGSVSTGGTESQSTADTPISIVWDGRALSSKGVNRSGKTYLPARNLGELAGKTVGFVQGKVTIDGKPIEDTILVDGSGYVRTTDLADAIGYVAVWGGKEQTVYMNKKK